MDLLGIRWRQDFGDGLPFLSPAVSGEVSPETVCPGSSQHPRDTSFYRPIAPVDALVRFSAGVMRAASSCARCSAIWAQKELFVERFYLTWSSLDHH
jgi:hypothetical protein